MNTRSTIIGKKEGIISIHVYRDIENNACFFYIQPDSEDLLPIVDILEDTLKLY